MSTVILNDATVELPAVDAGLLGWLRDRGLTAAKPGCLGGDCGACQVLLGERARSGAVPRYRTVNSCLLTTGLVAGCHLITVEGLNGDRLTPVQQALVDAGAIQCGYCTPGLVVALTGALLSGESPDAAAVGNLCRCTGYSGIRRACTQLAGRFDPVPRSLPEAARLGLLPDPVARAGQRLGPLQPEPAAAAVVAGHAILVAGNTDLAVRHPHARAASGPAVGLHRRADLRTIGRDGDVIRIGAAVTVAELQASPELAAAWPEVPPFLDRFGSPAVRHQATVGGNLANASPAADLAVLLLALEAELTLEGPSGRRDVPLAGFFHGYKRTDLGDREVIVAVRIGADRAGSGRLHAEKVARRTHDDIAGVCSTMVVTGGDPATFGRVALSAGGVAPVPLLLTGVGAALSGRPVTTGVVRQGLDRLDGAIAPIDDIRGSAAYKTQLLRHVVLAHLDALYPDFDVRGCLR